MACGSLWHTLRFLQRFLDPHERLELTPVFCLSIGEARIPQSCTNSQNTPRLDVVHTWYLAEPLDHRIIVHHNRGLLAANLWDLSVQGRWQVELTAFPVA